MLKYFHLRKFHESDSLIDELLEKNPNRKIVAILLDGFGKAIQETYSDDCPFILSHRYETISSVFPPTTVAATTSFLTGLYPNETGWVGWTEKFDMYPWPIVMFYDCYDDEYHMPVSVSARDLCPFKNIFSLMHEKGVKADMIQSFTHKEDTIGQFFNRVDRMIPHNDFLYAYHVSPDSQLHDFGVGDERITPLIQDFDFEIRKLVERNPDVIFFVFADHGHRNARYFNIAEHQDFYDCLRMKTYSIEARASTFLVEEEKKKIFEELATKYYGEHFDIYTKKQVLEMNLFGYGVDSPRFMEVLGDYLLVSKDESAFTTPMGHVLASTHAGSSREEREINVSVFNAF